MCVCVCVDLVPLSTEQIARHELEGLGVVMVIMQRLLYGLSALVRRSLLHARHTENFKQLVRVTSYSSTKI